MIKPIGSITYVKHTTNGTKTQTFKRYLIAICLVLLFLVPFGAISKNSRGLPATLANTVYLWGQGQEFGGRWQRGLLVRCVIL